MCVCVCVCVCVCDTVLLSILSISTSFLSRPLLLPPFLYFSLQRRTIDQLSEKMKSLWLLPRSWHPLHTHTCDLNGHLATPTSFATPPQPPSSFCSPGYFQRHRTMVETRSPEENERERERMRRLREHLMKIQRSSEHVVPPGE